MSIIEATVAGDISFPATFDYHTQKLIAAVKTKLTYDNPQYLQATYMGYEPRESDVPKKIACYETFEDWSGEEMFSVPRGSVHLLKEAAKEVGVGLKFNDQRSVGTHLDIDVVAPNFKLREQYQPDAIAAYVSKTQGVIEIPCGGGKTTVGIVSIARIKRSTLIIVHSGDLLEQWVDGVKRILGYEAGIVSDGKYDARGITVATIQTLLLLDDFRRGELYSRFGNCIVDEAHHTPSKTWQKAVRHVGARFRLGLTATPDREDGMEGLMYASLGPKIYGVSLKQLIDWGYLIPPKIRVIMSNLEYMGLGEIKAEAKRIEKKEKTNSILSNWLNPDVVVSADPDEDLTPEQKRRKEMLERRRASKQASQDYQDVLGKIVDDAERNGIIYDIIAQEYAKGESILVLSGEKEHCRTMHKHVTETLKLRAEMLTGDVKKKKRKEHLDEMRAGTLRIAFATQLADEGLDVQRLSRLILAYPGKSSGRLVQRLGRIMRSFAEKKDAIVYDIADPKASKLWKQYLARRKVYLSLGVDPNSLATKLKHKRP